MPCYTYQVKLKRRVWLSVASQIIVTWLQEQVVKTRNWESSGEFIPL